MSITMDEKRFPQLVLSLYTIVAELERMFPGRPFTPDGHMVGSIGECLVSHHYGVKLFDPSNKGHDGKLGTLSVEIKATQGKYVALRSEPEHLIAIRLKRDGGFEEIYNGPGAPVWDLVKDKPLPSNGQYRVSLAKLKGLMKDVQTNQRLPRLDKQAQA